MAEYQLVRRACHSLKKAAYAALLFASVQASQSVAAQVDELRQRLVAMDKNAASMSYVGTLIYSQGDSVETLKRFHTVRDGVRHERLMHLSGPERETIRTGGKVTCLSANREAKIFSEEDASDILTRPFTQSLLSDRSAYRLVAAGKARVAGRDTVRLNLQPKDSYRYGFSLALDAESNLLLQSLMLNEAGEVIERIEYIEIDIGQPIDERLLIPALPPGKKVEHVASSAETVSESGSDWRVDWVPAGFMMQSTHRTAVLGQTVIRDGGKTFGDGLSAFTVFLAKSVNMGNQLIQRGATTAYSMVKEQDENVYSVTVVGEIPVAAAKKIAASVSLQR